MRISSMKNCHKNAVTIGVIKLIKRLKTWYRINFCWFCGFWLKRIKKWFVEILKMTWSIKTSSGKNFYIICREKKIFRMWDQNIFIWINSEIEFSEIELYCLETISTAKKSSYQICIRDTSYLQKHILRNLLVKIIF